MSVPIRSVATVATPHARWGSLPTIACGTPGTWKTGQVVTCTPGPYTGMRVTLTYQWVRDAADISGSTAATHTLVIADETHKVRCRVTATPADANYKASSVQSPQSITITAAE